MLSEIRAAVEARHTLARARALVNACTLLEHINLGFALAFALAFVLAFALVFALESACFMAIAPPMRLWMRLSALFRDHVAGAHLEPRVAGAAAMTMTTTTATTPTIIRFP